MWKKLKSLLSRLLSWEKEPTAGVFVNVHLVDARNGQVIYQQYLSINEAPFHIEHNFRLTSIWADFRGAGPSKNIYLLLYGLIEEGEP